jgi:hypothetical protein
LTGGAGHRLFRWPHVCNVLCLCTSCRYHKFSETDSQDRATLCVRTGAIRPFAPVYHPRSRHLDTSLDRYATPHCKEFELYYCQPHVYVLSIAHPAGELADPRTARLGVRPPTTCLDHLIGSATDRSEILRLAGQDNSARAGNGRNRSGTVRRTPVTSGGGRRARTVRGTARSRTTRSSARIRSIPRRWP